jgi:hypothetical protein
MNTKTLEDLKSYEQRILQDVSRSRMQDQDGLSQQSPLMRNLRQVQQEIQNWKSTEETTEE